MTANASLLPQGAARPGSPTPRPSTAALPWPYGGDIFEESHATLSPIVPGVGEEEPFLGHLGMGMGLRVRRTINFAEAAESGDAQHRVQSGRGR